MVLDAHCPDQLGEFAHPAVPPGVKLRFVRVLLEPPDVDASHRPYLPACSLSASSPTLTNP